ncbi:MAG TPA: hypothetical protein VL199_12790 [Burkholderiales bacterium]|nr:hypothetical protein [Burkholderiales bacterium]
MARLELAEGGHAEESETDADLILEELERFHQSLYTRRCEGQAREPADADGFRAEGDGFHHVGATHEAAIDPDLGLAFDGLHDLRQHRGAAQPMIELATAMIGNIDDLHAVLDAELGILCSGNAFDDEREVGILVLEALHVGPIESGLEGGAFDRARAPGLYEPAKQVALPSAVRRHVDREAERAESVVAGTTHEVVDPGIITAHIELENARRLCGARRLLEPRLAHGGEHLRHAELRGAAGGGCGAALDNRFEAADRREHHRQPHLAAKKACRAVDTAHVAQDARPERNFVQRSTIAEHRGFGLGAAHQVSPRPGRQVPLRRLVDFLQGEEFLGEWCVHWPPC